MFYEDWFMLFSCDRLTVSVCVQAVGRKVLEKASGRRLKNQRIRIERTQETKSLTTKAMLVRGVVCGVVCCGHP